MPFFGPSVWSDRGRVRDSGRYSRRGRIEDAKRLSVRLYTRHCECARVVRRAVLCCRSMQYRAVMHTVGIVARGDLAAVQGHFLKFWGIAGGAKMTVSGTLARRLGVRWMQRSEEHTSELQSLMRISYAVFCLKKKKTEKT